MKKTKPDINDFIIIIDTREQLNWTFPNSISKGLDAGDYSMGFNSNGKFISLEKQIAIERKRAVSELYTASGSERERFERELEKLARLQCKFVICEFNYMDLVEKKPEQSQMDSGTVISSILSWQVKYNVPFLFTGAGELLNSLLSNTIKSTLENNFEEYNPESNKLGDILNCCEKEIVKKIEECKNSTGRTNARQCCYKILQFYYKYFILGDK